jgi:hypothetical protein
MARGKAAYPIPAPSGVAEMTATLIGILVMAQATFAAPAIAPVQDVLSFTGMLVDYDDTMLTVENDDDEYNVETMVFKLTPETQFFIGEESATIDDLSLYDDVTVEYTEEDGEPVALKVTIVPYDEGEDEDEPPLS